MKSFASLLILSLFLLSCEDVINIELPSTKPILVIDANINLFKSEKNTLIEGGVRLNLSANFFDKELPIVKNASVTLTNLNSGEVILLPFSEDEGWYKTKDSNFFSDKEASYELVIQHENTIYKSESKIYEVTPIDSIKQGTRTLFSGDEIEVAITFSDNGAKENYYLYDLGFKIFQPIRDQFFQGSSFTFSNFYNPENLSIGDSLYIKGYGISKQYYNYMELLLQQTGSDGGPFGTVAATVKGNIVNITNPTQNPLGYFVISEGVQGIIVIEDLKKE